MGPDLLTNNMLAVRVLARQQMVRSIQARDLGNRPQPVPLIVCPHVWPVSMYGLSPWRDCAIDGQSHE